MTMSGSPNRVAPLPNLVISHEDYTLLARLIAAGVTPRLEGRVENRLGKQPVQQWNTVAEIRGTEQPGQVVILGAHLDSWDLGTGTTDNGTGSMVVLEAARAMAQSGLKPKRTIRFILFSGEEQGLLGSRAYAAAHAAKADSIQAVLVLDNGTGADHRPGVAGTEGSGGTCGSSCWRRWPRSTPTACGTPNKSGTDHLSFLPYGVPGFNFDQLSRGYNHTHHSQTDTYDKAVAGRPEAGGGGHGGDRVGAGEPARAVAAGAEEPGGAGTDQAFTWPRRAPLGEESPCPSLKPCCPSSITRWRILGSCSKPCPPPMRPGSPT